VAHASFHDFVEHRASGISMLRRLLGTMLIGLASVLVAGCATRDTFPMRNAETGQEVTCHSGYYWIEEGAPQLRVATECMRACGLRGYVRVPADPYPIIYDAGPVPKDLIAEIPASCLD
jgi:hypothetical protein